MKTQMDKTLTFTVEDALLSPLGFAILSGAGLFGQATGLGDPVMVHVHTTTATTISEDESGELCVDLSGALSSSEEVDATAPIFIVLTEDDGSLAEIVDGSFAVADNVITGLESGSVGDQVFVDYYVSKKQEQVDEFQIDGEHFAGYYYVEADTLFRRQSDGVDLPAVLTFPNIKIQSNFTFAMASTGDPSTFTFTMDAFPGYTLFDKTHQVLCVLQVVNPDEDDELTIGTTVMGHKDDEDFNSTADEDTEPGEQEPDDDGDDDDGNDNTGDDGDGNDGGDTGDNGGDTEPDDEQP